MARCDRKRELPRVEVARDVRWDFAADRKAESRNAKRDVDADALICFFSTIVCAEDPESVLHDVAAEIHAVVVLLADVADGRRSCRQLALVARPRQQAASGLVAEHIAVKLVRSALR